MVSLQPAHMRRHALPDQVCEVLRERIIAQVYAPCQRLRVEDIAQGLGVSATPVREALNRLVSEQLVVAEPGRGFAVAPELDRQQYAEAIDVAAWLYEKAAELGVATVTDAELQEMAQACGGIDAACHQPGYEGYRAFLRSDSAFHDLMIAVSRNSALIDLWKLWNPHAQQARLFCRAFMTGDIVAIRRQVEHRPILAAFQARDPALAIQAIRQHTEAAKRHWLTFADLDRVVVRKGGGAIREGFLGRASGLSSSHSR